MPRKVKCGAETRKQTPCQCKALRNGRCKLHGGTGKSPFEIRKRHLIEKNRRRTERLLRRLGRLEQIAERAKDKGK